MSFHRNSNRTKALSLRIFALGESAGALLILRHGMGRAVEGLAPGPIAGYLLCGPVVKVKKEMPLVGIAKILSRLFPKMPLPGVDVKSTFDQAFGDQRWAAAGKADPVVLRVLDAKFHVRTGAETLTAVEFVDTGAAFEFFLAAGSEDKHLKVLKGAYHQLFQDQPEVAQQAVQEVISWLDARLPTEDVPNISMLQGFRRSMVLKLEFRTDMSTAPEELPIDDFSDYEDDAHARRSSLADLDEKDWSKVSKGGGPGEGASPDGVSQEADSSLTATCRRFAASGEADFSGQRSSRSAALEDLEATLGGAVSTCVAKDLTMTYERLFAGPAAEVRRRWGELEAEAKRGTAVLLLGLPLPVHGPRVPEKILLHIGFPGGH
eukprot:s1352_g4.t1